MVTIKTAITDMNVEFIVGGVCLLFIVDVTDVEEGELEGEGVAEKEGFGEGESEGVETGEDGDDGIAASGGRGKAATPLSSYP